MKGLFERDERCESRASQKVRTEIFVTLKCELWGNNQQHSSIQMSISIAICLTGGMRRFCRIIETARLACPAQRTVNTRPAGVGTSNISGHDVSALSISVTLAKLKSFFRCTCEPHDGTLLTHRLLTICKRLPITMSSNAILTHFQGSSQSVRTNDAESSQNRSSRPSASPACVPVCLALKLLAHISKIEHATMSAQTVSVETQLQLSTRRSVDLALLRL
jgi:hypothetical protein